jgi:hypothetical protein
MCINFMPPTRASWQAISICQLATCCGRTSAGKTIWHPSSSKGRHGEAVLQLASYGMVPKRHQPPGVRISTMNARRNHW